MLHVMSSASVFSYVFCEDDQGSLLGCQLCDESRVEGKRPHVSFISSVEENRPFAFIPVLIWQGGKKQSTVRYLFAHILF